MRFLTALIAIVFALGTFEQSVESAKILAIFPFPGPSQYILVLPYFKALAARGHEVTVINAFPRQEKIKNFRDIPALKAHESYNELILQALEERNHWMELNFNMEFFANISLGVLNEPNVQQLLRANEHFDLVIVEALPMDALFGFAQHYNAPLIGISSFGTDAFIDTLVGNTSPVSYTPVLLSGYTDRMTFWERLKNLAYITIDTLHIHFVQVPAQAAVYKKYFPQAKVELQDLRLNFSLMLLNQHFSLSYPRPYVPAMIEVGGFHLNHKPKPLPADMEAFLNASTQGVIYFSMGSNIQSKDLPKEKLEILLTVFASLKPVRVMWKFEETNLPGKPENVFISKWFPQPDILAHPKVRLFITHGGLLSTIEAIYHSKPVIGIPMFYDQFLNVERAKKAGFGLRQDFSELSVEGLRSTIKRILEDKSFAELAAKMSRRYHDQPMSPLDTAIYWTEYVLRHEGAPHMRVAAQDLNFAQQNSLDTIAVLFGGLFLALALVVYVVLKLLRLIFQSRTKKEIKQKIR